MTQTKFAYKDLVIELGEATDEKDISKFVTAINGWNVENILEEVTGASEDTDRWAAIGFLQKNEVELTGPYDTTAEGLVAITKAWEGNDLTATKRLILKFDGDAGTDKAEVDVLLHRIQRNPSRGAFHEYIVTLRPTGEINPT